MKHQMQTLASIVVKREVRFPDGNGNFGTPGLRTDRARDRCRINLGLVLLVAAGFHIYHNWGPITAYLRNEAERLDVEAVAQQLSARGIRGTPTRTLQEPAVENDTPPDEIYENISLATIG